MCGIPRFGDTGIHATRTNERAHHQLGHDLHPDWSHMFFRRGVSDLEHSGSKE